MGFMAILLLNVAPRNEVACPKSSLPFLWYFRMNVSGCLPTRSIVLWGPKCPVGNESGRASYVFPPIVAVMPPKAAPLSVSPPTCSR